MKRPFRNLLFSLWDMSCFHIDLFISTWLSRMSLAWQGCAPGPGFRTTGRCWFKARNPGSIRIGRNVTLFSSYRSNRVGLTQPVMLQTMGNGRIEIGDYVGASGVVISSRSSVVIGERAMLGGNVRIYDHDFHSMDPRIRCSNEDACNVVSRPVFIGERAFVGVNAIILKGSRIGAEAVIGAGAVVAGAVPPGEIWAGNPARKIR